MLKLTLTPGANLDKVLELASKSLYSTLEAAGKEGILRVYAYPNLDSLTAATIVFMKATSMGVNTVLSVSLDPPQTVGEPTVIIGFNNLNYKSGDVKSRLVAFYSGELKSIPVHGVTYIDGPGSHSSIAYLTATGGKDYDLSYVVATLTGSYASGFVDRIGRFQGLDRIVLDKLRLATRLSLEMITTIRSYKPTVNDVCSSLSVTLDPYYPGFTGDHENCVRVLQSRNLASILGVKLSSLDQKSLESLVTIIVDTVKRSYNVDLEASELVGGVLVSTSTTSPVLDFKEASDSLVYIAEALGDPGRVVVSILDVDNEYPMVESRFEGYSVRLRELVSQVKPVKLKVSLRTQFYQVQVDRGDSPTMLWRALRTLRMVERDSVLVFELGGELRISPFQVEEAIGLGGCRRLRDLGIVRFEDGYLWVERKALA